MCAKELEAMTPQEAGAVFRDHPSPSAPIIDDHTGNLHIIVPMNRAMSFPVEASS